MIKDIISLDQHLVFNKPSMTYINPHNQKAGPLRYNSSLNVIEVYDGFSWVSVATTVSVHLSPEVNSLLEWVKSKRDFESEVKKAAENMPALAHLLEQREEIDSKIKVLHTLTKS